MKRLLLLSLPAAIACGAEAPAALDDVGEASARAYDAAAILAFVNGPDATFEKLAREVLVPARAAGNIAIYVRGDDGVPGTGDDEHVVATLDELDAIPQVGPASLSALDRWVRAHAPSGAVTVEGVALTADDVREMLQLAAAGTLEVLTEAAGARVAREIIAARPIATVEALGAVRYVGAVAIGRLRDYARAHPSIPSELSPQITRLQAELTYDFDTVWEEHNDGARVEFETQNARDCDVGVYALGGALLVERTSVGTSGPYFVGEWNSSDPRSPWLPGVEVRVTCRNAQGSAVSRSVRVNAPAGPAPTLDCSALRGGTFDGVRFTAAAECRALSFLDDARFSEMGALPPTARKIAYDCAPSGACGFRAQAWLQLAQFADYPGIGATAMRGLHAAIDGWTQSGASFDTVASVWADRAALVDQPVNLDAVVVTRKLPDQHTARYDYSCVELRDTAGARNYISACLQYINADSAPGCTDRPEACLAPWIGQRAQIRGSVVAASDAPGGYRIQMQHEGPSAANPAR